MQSGGGKWCTYAWERAGGLCYVPPGISIPFKLALNLRSNSRPMSAPSGCIGRSVNFCSPCRECKGAGSMLAGVPPPPLDDGDDGDDCELRHVQSWLIHTSVTSGPAATRISSQNASRLKLGTIAGREGGQGRRVVCNRDSKRNLSTKATNQP